MTHDRAVAAGPGTTKPRRARRIALLLGLVFMLGSAAGCTRGRRNDGVDSFARCCLACFEVLSHIK